MKVLCRKIISPTGKDLGESSPWLKVGNEYVVFAMLIAEDSGIQIYIQTEHYNEPHFSSLIGFEFINQNIPSSWITVFRESNGRKVMTMLPASWNYDNFFEDMEDQNPKAIELFNMEVKEIYHEEGMI